MREHELLEGMRRSDGLTQLDVQRAIYRYAKDNCQNGDTAETWAEFRANLRELKSYLTTPLKVYRGLYIEVNDDELLDAMDYDWDAHDYRIHCPDDLARYLMNQIDWKRLGTSWTWDRDCAVTGGKLSYANDTNVIIEAVVDRQHVDLLVTMFQNLTTYQEEREVRLFPNTNIKVTGIVPNNHGLQLPLRANTGPEDHWPSSDKRQNAIRELFPYLKR